MLFQQRVAVIVEVADQRRLDPEAIEPLFDMGHGGGGLGPVDGDAHQLRAGPRQRRNLGDRRRDIGRVGIGHRLHHDRGVAADRDVADPDRNGAPVALASPWRPGYITFGEAAPAAEALGLPPLAGAKTKSASSAATATPVAALSAVAGSAVRSGVSPCAVSNRTATGSSTAATAIGRGQARQKIAVTVK